MYGFLGASHGCRPFADFLTGLPRRASALAPTLTAVALAGWSANIDIMRRLLPGAPLIVPNTALALVLLTMSVVLLDGTHTCHRRQLAALIGALVPAFGLLTVVQYVLALSLPSDRWLFGDRRLAADMSTPGRAARAAGLSLALPTAIALALLAAGTIALRSSHGVMALFLHRGPPGEMARRLVPPTLIVPPLVAILVVSGRIRGWYGPSALVSILLRANQRFAEMFGIDATRDIGVNRHDFVIGERIPSSEMLTPLEKGEVASVEAERPFRRRDGPEIWVRASIPVASTTEGEADFHIVVADDLSGRKRVEEEPRVLDQRMERLVCLESIGALAGGVAHDFNNILASILGNASSARSEVASNSTLASHLAEVEQAARRAANLTSQLLAYAGKSMRRPEPVQLDALARDAVRVFEPCLISTVQPSAGVHLLIPAHGATLSVRSRDR
jgi:PAS domain S-box-containing protein